MDYNQVFYEYNIKEYWSEFYMLQRMETSATSGKTSDCTLLIVFTASSLTLVIRSAPTKLRRRPINRDEEYQ